MKRIVIAVSFFVLVPASLPAFAWLYFSKAKIEDMTQWQDDGPVYFRSSTWGVIPPLLADARSGAKRRVPVSALE
jgi:hypothetical protein